MRASVVWSGECGGTARERIEQSDCGCERGALDVECGGTARERIERRDTCVQARSAE